MGPPALQPLAEGHLDYNFTTLQGILVLRPEAFPEQKFNGMCVPEMSDQLRPMFFSNSDELFVLFL